MQFRADWCRSTLTSRYLPYDFVLPDHKIIIELDGAQNFVQVSDWLSPEEQFARDFYKEKCANDNGYSTIRILQEDVFADTYDWRDRIVEAIQSTVEDDSILNLYLSENNEYALFIEKHDEGVQVSEYNSPEDEEDDEDALNDPDDTMTI